MSQQTQWCTKYYPSSALSVQITDYLCVWFPKDQAQQMFALLVYLSFLARLMKHSQLGCVMSFPATTSLL